MDSPQEGCRHVEPVLGTDDDVPPSDQPESPYLSLDELFFGAVAREADVTPEASRDPVDEPPPLDDDRFVEEHEFGEHEELIDDDDVGGDDELGLDDTIVAEPAEIDDATDPTGAERGRRRAWVLAGLVTLIVVAGGRSADSAPGKRDSVRKAPSSTTTPTVPTTALPSTASTPAPVTAAPLTAATASRAVPLPTGIPTQPPPPPATSPPPSTTSPP
ncbi:MAG TPA: hypothetical protein VFA62_00270 [Acidimicrobiia bacterium]|nr:hypothetical protein [Acidimicrobiia bacterium]